MLRGNQGGVLPGPRPRLQKPHEKLIKTVYGLLFSSVLVFADLSSHSRVPSSCVILCMAV